MAAAPSIPGTINPAVNALAVDRPATPRSELPAPSTPPVITLSFTTFAVPARGTFINFGVYFQAHLNGAANHPPMLLKIHFDFFSCTSDSPSL